MYFDELAPYGMLAEFAPAMRVRAVGWLQRGSRYRQGSVDSQVLSRLFEFVETEWTGPRVGSFGYHACDLCPNAPQKTGTLVIWQEPGPLATSKPRSTTVGGAELYVPGNGCVYAAPSMILHYILAHGYCPPAEFTEALLSSPVVGSPEYLRAVRANGGGQYV